MSVDFLWRPDCQKRHVETCSSADEAKSTWVTGLVYIHNWLMTNCDKEVRGVIETKRGGVRSVLAGRG